MATPGQEGIREVQRRLRAHQGAFVPKPQLPVIDEVVATVLSQHTSDVNSERAFARLKERFPTWEQVADAPADEVAEAIRCGGIADLAIDRDRPSPRRGALPGPVRDLFRRPARLLRSAAGADPPLIPAEQNDAERANARWLTAKECP